MSSWCSTAPGRTRTALELLRSAERAGATTIAVHGVPGSALEQAAEIPLYTGIRNGTVWTQHFAGRASDTLLTSMLWLLVAQRRSADPTMRFVDDGSSGSRTHPPLPIATRTS